MVRGHNADKRKRYYYAYQYRSDQPQDATCEKRGTYTGEKAQGGQRSLHNRSSFVAWSPNRRSGFRVATHSRRVLDKINVNCRAGEKRATEHRKKLKADNHTCPYLLRDGDGATEVSASVREKCFAREHPC